MKNKNEIEKEIRIHESTIEACKDQIEVSKKAVAAAERIRLNVQNQIDALEWVIEN